MNAVTRFRLNEEVHYQPQGPSELLVWTYLKEATNIFLGSSRGTKALPEIPEHESLVARGLLKIWILRAKKFSPKSDISSLGKLSGEARKHPGPNKFWLTEVVFWLGNAHFENGEPEVALPFLHEAWHLIETSGGCRLRENSILNSLLKIHAQTGDFLQFEKTLERLRTGTKSLKSKPAEASYLTWKTVWLIQVGRYREALAILRKAELQLRRGTSYLDVFENLRMQADVVSRLGDFAALKKILAKIAKLNSTVKVAVMYDYLGIALRMRHALQLARLEDAKELFPMIKDENFNRDMVSLYYRVALDFYNLTEVDCPASQLKKIQTFVSQDRDLDQRVEFTYLRYRFRTEGVGDAGLMRRITEIADESERSGLVYDIFQCRTLLLEVGILQNDNLRIRRQLNSIIDLAKQYELRWDHFLYSELRNDFYKHHKIRIGRGWRKPVSGFQRTSYNPLKSVWPYRLLFRRSEKPTLIFNWEERRLVDEYGREIPLPKTEQLLQFLKILASHRNGVVGYNQLVADLWPGEHYDPAVHGGRIRNLAAQMRTYLARQGFSSDALINLPGRGYSLTYRDRAD